MNLFKIENEIGNPFYNMYILKGIVDVAREVRVDYLHKRDEPEKTLSNTSKNLYTKELDVLPITVNLKEYTTKKCNVLFSVWQKI